MNDDQNIIRYLDGEMEEDEKLAFERKISGNQDLAQKVEAFRNIQKLAGKAMRRTDDPEESLSQETREEIRQAVLDFKEGKTEALPPEVDQTIKSARQAFEQRKENGEKAALVSTPGQGQSNIKQIRRIWWTAAAVVVLAVIVSLHIFRPFKSRPVRDLYVKYYKEFPISPEVTELSRADNDLLFATKVYEAGDYKRAGILFEMLEDSAGLREYSLFYAGQSYLHQNLTENAIDTFQQLLEDASGDMVPLTRWYLALCYLKTGETALSKEQLIMVAASDSPFRKDARRLLRDLQ